MTTGLEHALDVFGDRWGLQIVAELLGGAKRFGELAEALPGIAPNVLSTRLRRLEKARLVDATPYSKRPVRLAYSLTESGHELADAIALLAAWGSRQTGTSEAPLHHTCGSRLEVRLYCPTCERAANENDNGDLHWT